jgi:hypothetical protein
MIAWSLLFLIFYIANVIGQANYSARSGDKLSTIAAGEVVTLDTNVSLTGALTIFGTLQCADKDLDITAARILVKGTGKFIVTIFVLLARFRKSFWETCCCY